MSKKGSFRLEAEDMFLRGFLATKHMDFASADGLIFSTQSRAKATDKFEGESGRYKVVVHYVDEADGEARVKLKVGSDVAKFAMDDDTAVSRPSEAGARSTVAFDDVQIDHGERLKLVVRPDGGELGAIDFIEFIALDEERPIPRDDAPTRLDAFEMEVVSLINEIRASEGLQPLRISDKLSEAAEEHSEDMAAENYFGHTGSDGSSLRERTSEQGYNGRYVGENIGAGHDTAEQIVTSWMHSDGHRANILNSKFNEIGVGFVSDPESQYTEYWTQVFGFDAHLV